MVLLVALLCVGAPPVKLAERLKGIELPAGFSISVYSDQTKNARAMARGPKGTVFVGSRREGKVYAVVDSNADGRADAHHVLAEGLTMPVGVDVYKGALYVSEVHRILRFDRIESRLKKPPKPVVVYDKLPKIRHHGWKFIRFGPDGWLYVPVGAPCNICESKDPRFASILRMKPNGGSVEVYASGVRNTVGFDWHPATKRLWFTDNGRDWLGDDRPPDELNAVKKKGQHFGYPHCHGADLSDPEFGGEGHACKKYTPPAKELGPHVAPLGMRFYTGAQFPKTYQGRIFIAEHGSWNRSKKIGYRLMTVRTQNGRALSYEVFAKGWLKGDLAWGRPVDVLVMPDGALLVSDDRAGAIYRIAYSAPRGI